MHLDGYAAKIVYDSDDDLLHGQVINCRDVITSRGQSVEQLREAFGESLADYRSFCREQDLTPSGPLEVRESTAA